MRTEVPPPLLYVYCAVRGDISSRTVGKLPALPDADAPRVLPLTDDVSLIVADVAADTYRSDAVEAQLSDIDWVGRVGNAHHAVADALAPKHAVVPLRVFTMFSSEARAREAFLRMIQDLQRAFDRVAGKAEWVLRIGKPDPKRIAVPAASARREEPTTGTSFLAQKAAAKQLATEMAARVKRDAAAVYEALAKLADQSAERPVEPGMALLVDAAFLVPVRQTAAFKRALEQQARGLLRDGCHVSLTGPWPPYSFVAIESGGGDE